MRDGLRIRLFRGVRAALAALALACAAAAAVAEQASAHASVVAVEPPDGAVIAAAPSVFRVTFSEPTSPLVLRLVSPDGSSRTLDRFVLRDRTLEIEAPADLGSGTHVLTWRTISEDGHPVGGSSIFSIGAPSAGVPADTVLDDNPRVRAALWASKLLIYAGLLFGIGGVFFVRVLGGPAYDMPSVVPLALAAGLIALPTSVGLQGLDALGQPPEGLFRIETWVTGAGTSYGRTAAIALAAFVAAFAAIGLAGRLGVLLAVLAFAGIGAALAASGHASAAAPQKAMRAAVFLHTVSVAFWIGALAPLAASLAVPGPRAAALLSRFSRAIPFAILGLVLSGIVLALVQVASPEALVSTAYGRVFLVKLGLLVGLFALALNNRTRLTVPAGRGDAAATRQLRRSITVEIGLAIAVLAVVATWRFTPPPRALAEAAGQPLSVHLHGAKAMAVVTITPGRAGLTDISIALLSSSFGPLEAREVDLVLSQREAGIAPFRRPASRADDGTWRVNGLLVPVPGRWTVGTVILITDFELERLEAETDLRP